MTPKQLQTIARRHGTPVVAIDHSVIRRNYATFRKHLPRVQAYYAVKANPAPGSSARCTRRRQLRRGLAPRIHCWCTSTYGTSRTSRPGLHLGQDRLRQPGQAQGDAGGARPVQALVTFDKPGRAAQDQALRPARGGHAAPARPQHGLPWWNCPPSLAATPGRRWTSSARRSASGWWWKG